MHEVGEDQKDHHTHQGVTLEATHLDDAHPVGETLLVK